MTPNQPMQRTRSGGLRPPARAADGRRWASRLVYAMSVSRSKIVLGICLLATPALADTIITQAQRLEIFAAYGMDTCKTNLSKLKVVTSERIANLHDSEQIDERVVLRGGGLKCHVYVADVTKPRQFVFEASLESTKEKMPLGLKFGASKADVVNRFGLPDKAANLLLQYVVPGELEDSDLEFGFAANGRLSRIKWRWPYE